MPYYFMRDTPLQALEQLMMSQPGQKPRGGGIYRSPFHYTPKDVACEYCQNYDRKHPCRLCECTCLEERIEAGVLEMNRLLFLVFIQQIGNILLAVPHHKRIITVINNEPTFAAYYAKKRAEGKEHRVALTHVAKKLLRVIYTLQTKELSYNPDFVR